MLKNVPIELTRRVLIFNDSLIKLLKKRGHVVKILTNQKYYDHNGTKLIIFGEYYYDRIR